MTFQYRSLFASSILALLTACGGGGGGSDDSGSNNSSGGGTTPETPTPVDNGALDTPTYTGDKLDAFNYINELRAAAGLEPFKQSSKLDAAANAHVNYMVLNKTYAGHTEVSGNAGYTGSTAASRIAATGASYNTISEGVWSDLNVGTPERTAVDVFMNSVYHRVPLLSNAIGNFGMAHDTVPASDDYPYDFDVFVFNYGGNSQSKISAEMSIWPVDGSTSQPTFMYGENPDPAPDLTAQGIYPGAPVSLSVDAADTIKVDVFALNCAGQDIASRILTTDTDVNTTSSGYDQIAYLSRNWAFLLPEAPLPNSTTCTVTFQGSSIGTGRIIKTWSFTTAADARGF